MQRFLMLAAAGLLAAFAGGSALADENHWPRFRGTNGAGVSQLKGLPVSWTEEDYEWVVRFDGRGHSSPIIWENKLFLTSSSNAGERTLHCLDALTGEALWQDSVQLDASHLHQKNSYAAGTPATDGERVFVSFGDEAHYVVLCYDLDGERLWTRDLGAFSSQHGFGISPMIYEDMVICPNDQRGPSAIVALDVHSGQTRWTTARPADKASYATPLAVEINGQPQLITLSGSVGLAGLDPRTGRELWNSGKLPERTVASPVAADGRLLATCGSGGRGKLMISVDLASLSDSPSSPIVEERKQNLPYVPTLLVHDNHAYLWNDDGVVCCVDLAGDLTANVWRERIGGNYSGSPILVDGRIYCVSEEGQVGVLDASPTYRFHGFSPLGDLSYATPAVANGRLYLRGFNSLSCLKARTDGEEPTAPDVLQ